jgi:hypothetical protein
MPVSCQLPKSRLSAREEDGKPDAGHFRYNCENPQNEACKVLPLDA